MPMMIRSYALVVLLLGALTSCDKSKSKSLSNQGADSLEQALAKLGDTSGTFKKVGHQYGPPTGKIRVANLLELDGKPSGPVDIYDVPKPDSSAAPIIKHLAYGQISEYVSPRAGDNYAGSSSNLYLFPADVKEATPPFGERLDNGGFDTGDQASMAIGPTKGISGAASVAIVLVPEAGKRVNVPLADSATAIQGGQGLLVVREANMNVDSMPEQYLMVDGACPHAPNDGRATGDTAAYRKQPSSVSALLFFPVAPGTHTLGVVTSKRGSGLSSCSGLTPGATISLNVEAGRRYMVWVYGQPSDGMKVVAAPIATP